MKQIETDIIITSIRAKVDRSVSFSATTPELTADEKVAFMELQGENLRALLVPESQTAVPRIKVSAEIDSKTPSQRLRAVLFVFWEQSKKTVDFERFYEEKMEQFIQLIKDKLE